MSSHDFIELHNLSANEYDQQAKEQEWYGAEILFGLCFEYIKPNQNLLDIAIGTGLASIPFARLGLEIYGIDGSIKMLEICKQKKLAQDLKQFDLNQIPLPYHAGYFDYVLSCGFFHFMTDLANLFQDISRIIKSKGIFAFTFMTYPFVEELNNQKNDHNDYVEKLIESVTVIEHNPNDIERLLKSHQFEWLKKQPFLVKSNDQKKQLLFNAYITAKK